jgi:hypothetical protein
MSSAIVRLTRDEGWNLLTDWTRGDPLRKHAPSH